MTYEKDWEATVVSRLAANSVYADTDGWGHMGDWGWGWWVVFPVVMMIFMTLMMSRMFFLRRGESGMGPMGGMGGHGGENHTAGDSALQVLRQRYAAGDLTDEEFDAKRRRLEGR